MSSSAWVCVLCAAPLTLGATGDRCERCGAQYPRAGGVRVLTALPVAALMSLRDEVLGAWAHVESRRAALARASMTEDDAAAATRALDAERLSQALLERLAEPVLARIREHPPRGSLPELLARSHAGWPLAEMLPYAYADWAGERDPMRDRIAADVARHARDRGAALVLGCGAAALVADLTGLFEVAYGADLSLPVLLLARRLLDGESLCIPLTTSASAAPVTIQGLPSRCENAQLVAGDAAALPLADGSTALVVTPYLLDIVPDPSAVLREVNRILAPEGLWIQHGLPFRLREDPPEIGRRTADTWPALAARFGFDVLSAERVEHLHLDLRAVDRWSKVAVHPLTYAVARKRACLPRWDAAQAAAAYFAGETAALRARIPSLVDAQIEVVTRLGPGGREVNRRISFGGRDIGLRGARQEELLDLLGTIDGTRSVAVVAEALQEGARPWPERDVVLALDVLRRMGFVEMR